LTKFGRRRDVKVTQRRLTVVQVVPALDSGGVERGTCEVAEELVRRGHRSIVISAGGKMTERLLAGGSEHIAWSIGAKSPWTLRYVPALRELLREEKVDILHARSRVPAWISWLAWKSLPTRSRPRFVTTVHGPYTVGKYSQVMTQGDAVIAVSKTIRDYVLKNYPHVEPARLRVIPRGRDQAEFPHGYHPSDEWMKKWYEEHPHTAGKIILTLPARLTRWKGQEDFIQLIGDLRQREVNVHGLLVGGWDPNREAYVGELRQLIAHDGLEQHVTMTGHRRDIRDLYGLSSIVFSLSNEPEAFGRTTLEALSLGIPVIGYDHGGVGETLRDVFPAGVTPLGNRASLIEKTMAILKDGPFVVPKYDGYHLHQMLETEIQLYGELAA
jgi:glycosyltransferase involved in cell wall biosynthesis